MTRDDLEGMIDGVVGDLNRTLGLRAYQTRFLYNTIIESDGVVYDLYQIHILYAGKLVWLRKLRMSNMDNKEEQIKFTLLAVIREIMAYGLAQNTIFYKEQIWKK